MSLLIVILGPLIILGVLGGDLVQKVSAEADWAEDGEKDDEKAAGRSAYAMTIQRKAERMKGAVQAGDFFLQQVARRIAENLQKRSEDENEWKGVSVSRVQMVQGTT